MQWSQRGKKLLGLCALFFTLFNFPLITILDKEGMIWGIPTLYLGIFGIWLGLILLLYLMMEWR